MGFNLAFKGLTVVGGDYINGLLGVGEGWTEMLAI
jgi:hypothetical protein